MFNAIRLKKRGLAKVFGLLEAEIMELAWQHEEVTVRELHRTLFKKRDLAYTTVMTVADRLYKKGFLKRMKKQAGYLYQPALSRERFNERLMEAVFRDFLADFKEPAISYFMKLAHANPKELERLRYFVKHIERLKQGESHA